MPHSAECSCTAPTRPASRTGRAPSPPTRRDGRAAGARPMSYRRTRVRRHRGLMANEAAKPGAHKWVIAGTVMTGTIMAVLDSSIVNVALPDMSGTLGVTIEEITWVVTAYILAQVIVMPITGLLASRFGRKRFYMSSVALFTGASMACGL